MRRGREHFSTKRGKERSVSQAGLSPCLKGAREAEVVVAGLGAFGSIVITCFLASDLWKIL